MASEYEVIADEAWSVLEVDRSASQLLRHMYPDRSVILEALSYFALEFPPTLLTILQSSTPPSSEQLRRCSLSLDLDLSAKWIVYVQIFKKDGEVLYHVYGGSSVNVEGGQARLSDYDSYFTTGKHRDDICASIIKLVEEDGYIRTGVSILAAATICSDALDFAYLRACILLLEGTLTSKFWLYTSSTYGSITSCRLWSWDILPYRGLCGHSSLREVVPPRVQDTFDNPDIRRDWEIERAERRKEANRANNKKYRASGKGTASKKESYATPEGKAKQKANNEKYLASEKGKANKELKRRRRAEKAKADKELKRRRRAAGSKE